MVKRTQDEEIEITRDDGYKTEREGMVSESIHRINDKPFQYAPMGMGEYFCVFGNCDSDDANLAW